MFALALMAAGCAPESEGPSLPNDPIEESGDGSKDLDFSPGSEDVPQVLGFDEAGRILAVTATENGGSVLYGVDSGDGKVEQIVQTEIPITEAESHPSGRLLLRLDGGQGEANLRLIGPGTTNEDIIVKSHDVSWSWNADDWKEMYITAFDENWSFDVFLADASSGSLAAVEDAGPFPVWTENGGVVEMMDDGDMQDGGSLVDGDGAVIAENVLEFATDGSMYVIAQADGDGSVQYLIGNGEGDWLPLMTLPSGGQWVGLLPAEIKTVGKGKFATLLPAETDDAEGVSKWQPAIISTRGIQKSTAMVDSPIMTCSAETSLCLTGAMSEMLFDTADGTVINWMEQIKRDSGE